MSFDWAKPGAEVVCIDDDWEFGWYERRGLPAPDRIPMLNEVLAISQAVPHERIEGDVALVFEGMPECWAITHFRPLVTRTAEQDAELFAPLLGTKSEMELVR